MAGPLAGAGPYALHKEAWPRGSKIGSLLLTVPLGKGPHLPEARAPFLSHGKGQSAHQARHHRPDRLPEGAGVLSPWALGESPCLKAPPADPEVRSGSRHLCTSPSRLPATHLGKGRNGLEAHALLSTGGRPAAGPPAALGAFRLPTPLPLQQEGSRQVPGQLGAGPFCIPTRQHLLSLGGWALLRASPGPEPLRSQRELVPARHAASAKPNPPDPSSPAVCCLLPFPTPAPLVMRVGWYASPRPGLEQCMPGAHQGVTVSEGLRSADGRSQGTRTEGWRGQGRGL